MCAEWSHVGLNRCIHIFQFFVTKKTAVPPPPHIKPFSVTVYSVCVLLHIFIWVNDICFNLYHTVWQAPLSAISQYWSLCSARCLKRPWSLWPMPWPHQPLLRLQLALPLSCRLCMLFTRSQLSPWQLLVDSLLLQWAANLRRMEAESTRRSKVVLFLLLFWFVFDSMSMSNFWYFCVQ